MKAMSKFWMALVVGVAVMAVSTQSWAVPLSNTDISWAKFVSLVSPSELADPSTAPGPPLPDTFAFQGGAAGDILSAVFTGVGDASGLYVYVYQFRVTSASGQIDELTVGLLGPGPNTVLTDVDGDPGLDPVSSFYIGSNVPDGFLFGQGDVAPSQAIFNTPPPGISFKWTSVPAGNASFIVGFFSPAPPTTYKADLSDTGDRIHSPFVYTPSPEPSVFLLLGMGLVGSAIWSRGRKKK